MGKPERRQQILDEARDVFAKRGYRAAEIDDIVAAAGVARGTFYVYFEDKRAVLEAIVDRTIARLGMSIVRVDPHEISNMPERSLRDGQTLGIVDAGDVRLFAWLAMGALEEVMFQMFALAMLTGQFSDVWRRVQRGAECEEAPLLEGILALFARDYLRV